MPPLLFLARVQRDGARRALRAALLAAAPAFSVLLLLRLWWTPGLLTPRAPFDLALLRAGLEALGLDWFDTGRALLLSGVMPLALAGAPLREARPFLRVYGYLALLFVALSVAAWVNVPSPTPVPLFGANTERLLIYALPLLIPLALLALERVLRLAPAVAPPPASGAEPSWLRAASVAACAAALLLPLLASQRYRRLPLHASRDGPLLMAFCRESLRTARQLERGEEVAFDPERMRFAWGIDDPGRLFEMRWFLREGWGPLAHYGIHDVVMREPRATLALPCLNPRALLVSLALQAEQPASFRVFVNGAAVGRVGASPEGAPASLLVPAGALVRGYNLLTLAALDGAPLGTRLRGLTLRAAR
jgi:hypothetical protein